MNQFELYRATAFIKFSNVLVYRIGSVENIFFVQRVYRNDNGPLIVVEGRVGCLGAVFSDVRHVAEFYPAPVGKNLDGEVEQFVGRVFFVIRTNDGLRVGFDPTSRDFDVLLTNGISNVLEGQAKRAEIVFANGHFYLLFGISVDCYLRNVRKRPELVFYQVGGFFQGVDRNISDQCDLGCEIDHFLHVNDDLLDAFR